MKAYPSVPILSTFISELNSSIQPKVVDFSKTEVWNITDTAEDLAVHQLLPTLAECFVIVLCGYICGRFQYISSNEIKGLTIFASHFALPSLIFLNLATIDLHNVHWLFIIGIILGKSLIFLFVATTTACFYRPFNLALIGIYGILCTQGSDFSLAYPVVQSIFGNAQSSYPGYMYIIAPLSHVLFNPIGFLLMEAEKARTQHIIPSTRSRCAYHLIIFNVFRGVVKNPCVIMTVLGILANLLFSGYLPYIIERILKMLSSSFSASILFLLGFTLFTSNSKLKSVNLTSVLLILFKMFIAPFILYVSVKLVCYICVDKSDLANYAFVYGTVPSGPIVLLFATQYGLPTEMLSSTLVLNNIFSAPLIFIASKLTEFTGKNVNSAQFILDDCILYISVVSLFASTWMFIISLVKGKWKRIPYLMIFNIAICQLIISFGVVLWKFKFSEKSLYYIQLIMIIGGTLSNRVWTSLLSVGLMLLRKNSFASIMNLNLIIFITILGFCLPGVIVTSLALMNSNRNEINQTNQVISSYIQGTIVVITVISLLLTVSGLLGYCRHSIPKLPLWIKKENSLNSDTNVHTLSSSSGLKTRSSQQEKSESKQSVNVEEQLQKSVLINALPGKIHLKLLKLDF
ncbi:lysosomal cholesterol signaling protein-like [Centruroides vittatus]|uniref:lysosomal cholesterol signaling protein-like n=1 Tax=Centruroides vittatus TaxID=120091 RepID=UPI00350F07F6